MKKLSLATCQLLLEVFSSQEDQIEAARTLANECADNLPFMEYQEEYALEPVRFAVMKLSRGSIAEFRWWVNLAKTDWRGVLAAAGFDASPTAYQAWAAMTYGITSTKPSGT